MSDPPTLAEARSLPLPLRLRVSLWMLCGAALGLPVDDLVAAIRSISEECLDHIVFLSEEHLREYVVGYLRHYNERRPHQGIGNVPIAPWTVGSGTIVCDESLHGLVKSFRRAA